MGAQLGARERAAHAFEKRLPKLQSLDDETAHLLQASIAEVATDDDGPILAAAILYGSVARGEERALTDPNPSDVDILLVFDQDQPLNYQERVHVFAALGRAEQRHLTAPREVRAMLATRTLDEWDVEFIASVARDGWLLWSRTQPRSLPATLAPVAERSASPIPPKRGR